MVADVSGEPRALAVWLLKQAKHILSEKWADLCARFSSSLGRKVIGCFASFLSVEFQKVSINTSTFAFYFLNSTPSTHTSWEHFGDTIQAFEKNILLSIEFPLCLMSRAAQWWSFMLSFSLASIVKAPSRVRPLGNVTYQEIFECSTLAQKRLFAFVHAIVRMYHFYIWDFTCLDRDNCSEDNFHIFSKGEGSWSKV